ncbi:MAG: isopentenyl phosphate kinase family protein [DPANN group archaeon]|nr:isopentenyl phosphate kinase family protein [DPANN group archaeon]
MRKLIMLKLGGSLITDKNKAYTVRMDVIKRIVKEIHNARKKGDFDLIVGHGAGSFAHQSASKYKTQHGIINNESYIGLAKVQDDAVKLNRILITELISAGENAISIQASSCAICNNSKILKWDTEPIKAMLDMKQILPVPYGDIGLDKSQGCCIISTEEILTYLAKQLGSNRIILAGKVDGVLDEKNNVIPLINKENILEIKHNITGSDAVDVTGGMLQKVEIMLDVAKEGIDSEIINGNKEGFIERALLGETNLGTRITK